MNNILSKILCSFFILLPVSFSAKAGLNADTTQLLANNIGDVSPNSFTRTVVKEANIYILQVFRLIWMNLWIMFRNSAIKKEIILSVLTKEAKNIFLKLLLF